MKLLKVILKSGVTIDLADAERIEVISREEVNFSYSGSVVREETKWTATPEKDIVTFLRVIKEKNYWEIRESEVAVFEYSKEGGQERINREFKI